jgi:hypothetical protein
MKKLKVIISIPGTVVCRERLFSRLNKKENILSALLRQIWINLDLIDPKVLGAQFIKSLNEKQLVFYFENESLQKLSDSFYGLDALWTTLSHTVQ